MARTSDPGETGTGVMSRRDAIVGALALAAGSLLVSSPERALAADGDPITVGSSFFGTAETQVARTGAGAQTVSTAHLNADNGAFGYYALWGDAQSGSASSGVCGTGSPGGYGVLATNQWFYSTALKAHGAVGSVGVDASVDDTGTAVRATAPATGVALDVAGSTKFSRSGTSSVPKGKTSRTVTVPSGVATGSMILVTMQGSAGSGVYLRYAKRTSATAFQVVLNAAAKSTAPFAWMIID